MYRPSASIVSEHAPWCSMAPTSSSKSPSQAHQEFLLVEVVVDLAVDEIGHLSAGHVVDATGRLAASVQALDEVAAE